MVGTLHDTDFMLWATEQAQALRESGRRGSNAPLDWDHLAEEIEGLVQSERRALASQIGRIIEHLMKLEASPSRDPHRGWIDSVTDARREIRLLIEDSPSLQGRVEDLIRKETLHARRSAAVALAAFAETPRISLEHLDYSGEQVLGDWFPENS